ncbi:unnamed protein product [Fraxinus pennsylvanica]|uniref:HMA domain-containing protein n=1 Tax=Fraxinus pennsylvanica TaxID=56036 RepID=A0AAD1Z7G9_9LAMI|nr:unnamed protein product [Fraxinus pennsylvanica]
MAQEAAKNHLRDIKNKTWILKTSIHCEGCKRKVKKILNQVQGVENVEVDIKQQKVIVTGNVEGDSLINKLTKSGKKAELCEKTEKKEKNSGQGRNKEKQIKRQSNEQKIQENGAEKEQKPAVNVQAVQDPAKISDGGASTSGSASKRGGAAEVDGGEVKRNEASDAGSSAKDTGPVKTNDSNQVAESKSEEKKPERNSAGEPLLPAEDSESKSGVASEKSKGGSVSGGENGASGKKKKKQGQNGNNNERAKTSVATPARTGSEKHDVGPPPICFPANHIPPRQHNYHHYPHPLHNCEPPPVSAVSYNTAYPTSSYTASYYAAPPPHSYAYSYPGQDIEPPPPPSDPASYPRQPLDSFEMFSEENTKGQTASCLYLLCILELHALDILTEDKLDWK